ncbi:N-acetylmuramoyl-L-alanine amidase [Clostridium disporicum]|uniref:Surface protein PspC n=1 Tax=Clostridium disporicum TaxID=84024 RepID=A0A174FI23_9CLOT|nr:N-acetylmuramoyl-L-alanine amidase [Clostridium disporicum]CUO49177.1 surface protein PspC [Clostridium disporicum]
MKFIKKVTFLVLFLFMVNLIMPNVDVQAFVDSNTSKINSNEELGLIFQDEMSIEDVNFDSENISDEGEDVNNINEEKRSVGDEPVVIKLENPIENHKLTGSFFVKGWAVGLEGISEVNVYIDGKLYGQATYGITRNDIGSKYPQYINSTNSGFNMEIEGYQNGVHEVKVIAIDIKGQKAEAKVNINVDTTTTVIMSKGTLKREQMISYLLKRNPSKSQEYAEAFVDYTINESNIEGVNHDILFSQMMYETGFLKFGGDVKEEQNNFAGLGAVGNGVPGESFPTIQIGIRAVVQHLKAYASTEALVQECVDTRFKYVQRGTALYVEHLGIPENPKGKGWAASNSYGYKILKIRDEIAQEPINYISKITSFKTTGEAVVGSKMTMIATATPEAETEYKFLVRDPSGYWKGLNDYSSKNSIEYTPTISGAYRYVVHVKHKKSNAEYDELQVIDLYIDKNDVKKLIVIDPGHNYGGDNGATSTHNGVTYIERDLNMQVSLKLKDELEKKGFTVVLTRNPEDRETIAVSESLRKRVDLANKLQADFFISIHQNSYTDSSVRGFEVYYSDALPETRGVISSDGLEYSLNSLRTSETEKVKLSKKIGSSIVSSVTSEMGLKNRGLKNKDFYVVKNTTMPSLLVECGFISNPDEAKNLANEQKQQKMAEIIAREIGKNL